MTDAVIIEKQRELPNFVYAGFWIRLLSYAIDMIAVSSVAGLVNSLVTIEYNFMGISLEGLIFWILCLLYFTLMTHFNNGQTLGKMVTNLRVISLDGKKLSWGQVVSRETFGRYVQSKIVILYLFIAFAPKKQSLFDMLSDTAVVKIDAYEYINL